MRPKCESDEYATMRFASVCISAMNAPYSSEIRLRTMKSHFHSPIAFAKNGRPMTRNPKSPAFDCTELTTETITGGESLYVGGIHVCSGKSGVFTANATAK